MKVTKLWLITILLVVSAILFYRFASIVTLFATAGIMAFLLSPLVNFMELKFKIKRGVCVLIVIVFVLAIFSFIIFVITPMLLQQISSLAVEFPRYALNIDGFLDQSIEALKKYGIPQEMIDRANQILEQSGSILTGFVTSVLTAVLQYSLKIFDWVIRIILTVYFIMDGKKMVDGALHRLPEKVSDKLQAFLTSSEKIVWNYLRAKALIASAISIVTLIGFSIMGSKYAILFAAMTFFLDFIPYFGSIIAGVIEAVIMLAASGWNMAIAAAIFVLVVQQIEGNLIEPKIQGQTIGIHPVWILFAVLACNSLWGPIGMIVAVPIAGFSKIIFNELFLYLFFDNAKEEL